MPSRRQRFPRSGRSLMAQTLRRAAGAEHELEQLEQRQILAADPITGSYPIWAIPYGSAVIDGRMHKLEWANAGTVVRANSSRDNGSITIKMLYNEAGLFIGADVRDRFVNVDGGGPNTDNKWDYPQDDSIGLYFDPDSSRDARLQPGDRFVGMNLATPSGPLNDPNTTSGTIDTSAGTVNVPARFDSLKGNPDRIVGGRLGWGDGLAMTEGTRWKSFVRGTVNNNSDVDTGYWLEAFLPWAAVGRSGPPVHGETLGMNFQVFFDDTGGEWDQANKEGPGNSVSDRFGARWVDDVVQGTFSSIENFWSGFRGPQNYAEAVFTDTRAGNTDRPTAPTGLTAQGTTGYGTHIDFTAPTVSQTQTGSVSKYEIRISSTPIRRQRGWDLATPIANTFTPRPAGQHESLRIGDLAPGTHYYIAVRAVDARGVLGDIAPTNFFTETTEQDTSGGDRVIVSPSGGFLVTESGAPWVMVGSHIVADYDYVRDLFSPVEGATSDRARQYFDALAGYGVNTVRLPLEWLPNPEMWIQRSRTEYNPVQRTFIHNVLREAGRVGIKVVLEPFNTYNYHDASRNDVQSYFTSSSFSTANGGPIASSRYFFRTRGTGRVNQRVLTMAAERMQTVMAWVAESPDKAAVLGYEPINEWDTDAWTGAATDDVPGAPGFDPADPEREFRVRAMFMTQLAARVRAIDPNVLLIHTGDEVVPRGPVARVVFTGEAFDVLDPHLYTTTVTEPINNPDADKSLRAAIDYAGLAAYWIANRRDNRPINNGEWGLTSSNWPLNSNYYTDVTPANVGKSFTLADDVSIYRATGWVMLASGFGGTGFRLGDQEFRSVYARDGSSVVYPVGLPIGMRQIQSSFSHFISDGLAFDWSHYDPTSLNGRLTFGGTNKALNAWGSTDGKQGLVYVVQDSRATTGQVANAQLKIEGLDRTKSYTFEVWSTGPNAQPLATIDPASTAWSRVAMSNNTALTLTLPQFSQDVIIKFKAL